MSARILRWLGVALVWLLVATASAQSTGSSFGGGDWGGSSGSSGGSGSSGSSSGGSYSGVSYDDPNAYEPPVGVQCLISVLFLVFLYFLFFRWLPRLAGGGGGGSIDVARVQIAVDARSRRFVQDTLRKLGRRGDTLTSQGRVELLGAAVAALGKARLAWIYAGAQSFSPMPAPKAQVEFKRLADEARAGYQKEVLRSADGATSTSAEPAMAPKEHEGEGAVLVTIVAASRRTLLDVRATEPSELDALLAQLAALKPAELVAMEVVWTPSVENDRMSSDELVQHYPTLTRLPGAVGGRVFCSYCGGPHAAELANCPHCGAPRDGDGSKPA